MFPLFKEVTAQKGLKHKETKHFIPKKMMAYGAYGKQHSHHSGGSGTASCMRALGVEP